MYQTSVSQYHILTKQTGKTSKRAILPYALKVMLTLTKLNFKGDTSALLCIIELLSSSGVDMWDGLVVTLSNTWLSSWYSFSSSRRSHERKHCAHENDLFYHL